MRMLRKDTAVVAVLLLAALAAGVVEQTHVHDSVFATSAHADLPVFEAGHDVPEHRAHIESGEQIGSSGCVACLLRQRPRGVSALAPSLEGFVPRFARRASVAHRATDADARVLPPPRGPPAA